MSCLAIQCQRNGRAGGESAIQWLLAKESIVNITVEVVEQVPDHMNTSAGDNAVAGNRTTYRFISLGRSTGELVRNGSGSIGERSSVA